MEEELRMKKSDREDRRNKVNELKVRESVQNDEAFREAANV